MIMASALKVAPWYIPKPYTDKGEFIITPALMMKMDEVILDRIAVGYAKEEEVDTQ
jgi:hypothetical protein